MNSSLIAGAAAADITPRTPQFLFGYPHVERFSTGCSDPLYSSALFLGNGKTSLLMIACDVIFVDRTVISRARSRIERITGIPVQNVMITATHTHSGPVTVNMLSNSEDPAIPAADPEYLIQLEDGIVAAAAAAVRDSFPAQLGLAIANGSCVGGNRHDPNGPSDPATPVLAIRNKHSQSLATLMVVCSMHPTVLHEDSTLISADFPGAARKYLQEHVLRAELPVIHHTGPCGNLSPRHITQANTVEEMVRIGTLLGKAVKDAVATIEFIDDIPLECKRAAIGLPVRQFPSITQAEQLVDKMLREVATLRRQAADPRIIRTAECASFGAEETLALSRAAANGRLQRAINSTMPAEIAILRIGPWTFVGWPGEVFVEFSLEVKKQQPNCYLISLANGELQGYLVTEEAVRNGTYEALNAVFASPESGRLLVAKTLELLSTL